MVEISDERFEELVDQALDAIPDALVREIDNLALLIEDSHPDGEPLLGLYTGVALPDRTFEDSGFLPDTITIYRAPLKELCSTEAELAEQIRITVLHEIGHYFGLDEKRLDELGYG